MAAGIEFLIRNLELRDRLTDAERAALEALTGRTRTFQADAVIVPEHGRTTESCLLFQGFAARSQHMENGARQLAAVHIPGDFVDLHSLLLKVMDHSVIALSDCTVLFIQHADLRAVIDRFPHLGRLLWLLTVIDGAIQRAWITCLGRRAAGQHLAHLICELYLRLQAIDLNRGNSFEFPPTQAELADMLGLSVVHVNRTLQDLRASGLVSWRNNLVTVHNFDRLSRYAEFDPTYLNLRVEPR